MNTPEVFTNFRKLIIVLGVENQSRRITMISKFLDYIMSMEFLAKWLLAWGIAANVLIFAWLCGEIIHLIAGL